MAAPRRLAAGSVALLLAAVAPVSAAPPTGSPLGPLARPAPAVVVPVPVRAGADTGQASPPPEPDSSVTHHAATIGGRPIRYTATAGTLILRDDHGKPIARMGYTAYTKDGVSDLSTRPITFAYNGGPGSSSIWLHMGALGPRRVVLADAKHTPPAPYQVVDNQYSLLDVSDLVMIDPVGTGLSRPLGDQKDSDFWGVDQDIQSVGQFIALYVTDHDRWNSPKYLLGESYGTMRSAGLVDWLQMNEGMDFNGVILTSTYVDGKIYLDDRPSLAFRSNDLAFELYFPSYAAVAWYQGLVADTSAGLESFLDSARAFASGPYAAALWKGDRLGAAEKSRMARRMARFTGLDTTYLERADLRVGYEEFTREVLREHGLTVGTLDTRFTGPAMDALGQYSDYDPQSAAVSPAFTAAFLDYYHRVLGVKDASDYVVGADLWEKWDWTHQAPGSDWATPGWASTAPDLAHALRYNPNLRVLVLQGYFDLSTPFYASEYTYDHMGLRPSLRSRIRMVYFRSGHMMYVRLPSLEKFKKTVAGFIEATEASDKASGGSGASGPAHPGAADPVRGNP